MDDKADIRENHFLGSGWSFPVTFSGGNYQLITKKYEANINDSIRAILTTRKGERNMEPQFGSGLQQFFFKKIDQTLRGEIRDAVETSLLDNEPRITVQSVEVNIADMQNGKVEIEIDYIYNQTNTRHNCVCPFYLNEGTNL